jgi:hypothetical protein
LCNERTVLRDRLTAGKSVLVILVIVVMVSNNLCLAPPVLERHFADCADRAESTAAKDRADGEFCVEMAKENRCVGW